MLLLIVVFFFFTGFTYMPTSVTKTSDLCENKHKWISMATNKFSLKAACFVSLQTRTGIQDLVFTACFATKKWLILAQICIFNVDGVKMPIH